MAKFLVLARPNKPIRERRKGEVICPVCGLPVRLIKWQTAKILMADTDGELPVPRLGSHRVRGHLCPGSHAVPPTEQPAA